jgi:hypothetical protein
MSKKLTYTNRKGQVYFFREVDGKRGSRMACSTKESENDLSEIPETHEIAETPNGQMSCRKKIKREITRDEVEYVESVCPCMVDLKIKIAIEEKPKALIIHSKQTDGLERAIKLLPVHPDVKMSMLTDHIPFEPVIKLELTDQSNRTFAIYRMCWMDKAEWMFLKEGGLHALLEEYMPHIGQETFYELF